MVKKVKITYTNGNVEEIECLDVNERTNTVTFFYDELDIHPAGNFDIYHFVNMNIAKIEVREKEGTKAEVKGNFENMFGKFTIGPNVDPNVDNAIVQESFDFELPLSEERKKDFNDLLGSLDEGIQEFEKHMANEIVDMNKKENE